MPLSLTSLFIGFILGVAGTAIVWNLNTRTVRNPETAKLTAVWSLNDVTAPGVMPAIIAERIGNIKLAAGTKVLVPQETLGSVPTEILNTCEVRMHEDVRVNAAIGKDRALIFTGQVAPRASAIFTLEAPTVRRLQADFQRMWAEGHAYVEQSTIADLAGKDGRVVDVKGRASDLMEYRGRKMLRITDGNNAIGIVTRQEDVAQYQGGSVRVIGRVARENGYAYIEADQISKLGTPITV